MRRSTETLETLDYTIRIGSTPTFSYFDLYLYSAYAAHYVYFSHEGRCWERVMSSCEWWSCRWMYIYGILRIIESFRLTFFLDKRKPLETTWPTSSGHVTRLRLTFLLLQQLLEVSELRQAFYVTFTQPTHVWGANLCSYVSVVLESQRFWIAHWSTIVNFWWICMNDWKPNTAALKQVQNTNANLNALLTC